MECDRSEFDAGAEKLDRMLDRLETFDGRSDPAYVRHLEEMVMEAMAQLSQAAQLLGCFAGG